MSKISRETLELARSIDGLTEWQKHVQTDSNINRDITIAIEVLKAQLGTNLAEVGTDTISRQEAQRLFGKALTYKEQIGKLTWTTSEVKQWIADYIEDLPSAQPEQCEDAVSREEVLNCLEWQYPDKTPRTKIMELPPATPKQRTGYWYPVGMVEAVGGESTQWGSAIAYHKCSECDEQALRDDFEQEALSEFCPHCGAKMKPYKGKE